MAVIGPIIFFGLYSSSQNIELAMAVGAMSRLVYAAWEGGAFDTSPAWEAATPNAACEGGSVSFTATV